MIGPFQKLAIQMLSTKAGGYALPFEVVSMLLLAAMIGCIVIAMKAPSHPAPKGKERQDSKKNLATTFELSDIESQNVLPLGEDIGGAYS